MIITIRTDQPEAEIGAFNNRGDELEVYSWYAHRELSKTLLSQLRDLLARHGSTFDDVTGIVVFRGPGSFTGLRIGITVANALAYGQKQPVVGAMGEHWQREGVARLLAGENDKIVLPEYGAEAHITLPKK